MSIAMVVPTLNEIDGMKKIMPQINRSWVDEIIIVDGGSTDGTIEESQKLGFKIVHQTSRGVGDAYRLGIEATNCDYILFFSPDGNHEIKDIPILINKIKSGYEIVHINRFGKTSKSEDPGLITGFGNRMFTFLVNVFFGGHFGDCLDGFKIIKRNTILELKLDAKRENYEQQICIRAAKLGIRIFEVDGNEPKRIGGERKMSPLYTGYQLSRQILREFIFWKFE
jgi:glycosyltransferase involved in cell wall biosynthesis